MEAILHVTHSISVPGNSDGHKTIENPKTRRIFKQQVKEESVQTGDPHKMQIPGHVVIHLYQNEFIDQFRIQSNQLHGHNTTKAITYQGYRGIACFENELPSDFNKVFDREIRQRRAAAVTRPCRSVYGIMLSKGGVTRGKGVFIADPAMEKDQGRSASAFFEGNGALVS